MATSAADVVERLGRNLTPDETPRVPGLLKEAAALVAGFLRAAYDPELDAVVVVESRIVARALTTIGPAGVASWQETAGPMSHQRTFTTEASSSGGVWLSAADKLMLAGLRSDMSSTTLVSERYVP